MPFNRSLAMEDYAHPPNKQITHALGIGLVVGLHVLIFWAINSGLARAVVNQINPPVEAILLRELKPEIVPLPLPLPPKREPPPVNKLPQPVPVPAYMPEVQTPVPAPAAVNAIAALTSKPVLEVPAPVAPPKPPAPAAAVRTAAGVNTAHCEKPDYPFMSRRQGEKGTVTLRFLVGVQGRVIQSEVEDSSGYTRLDEAARTGLSKCQFRPATVDGKAEQAWARMKYTWQLE
jgi:protein TonB